MDMLIGRQEAGQVTSTKDALVADVLLEGTASATGPIAHGATVSERSDRKDATEESTDRQRAVEGRAHTGRQDVGGFLRTPLRNAPGVDRLTVDPHYFPA